MKIVIYEIVHLDWVIPLAEIFRNSEHQITFIVEETMQKDIKEALDDNCYKKYTWHFYNSKWKIKKVYFELNQLLKINHFNVFWLNTVSSKHALFYLLKLKYNKIKLLVNIHDINNLFKSKWSTNIKTSIRHLNKRLLLTQCDSFLVNAERMKLYIEENKLTNKRCYWISPVFYKPQHIHSEKKNFIVVIPGTVDIRRRNYKMVLNAWEKFIINVEAKLILAGRVSENAAAVIEQINSSPLLKESVQTYLEDIPETVFQRILSQSTIIFSPQIIKSIFGDEIEEIYGITKNSGNSYDIIRHAKPAIVPEQLIVPKEIENSILRYKSEKELVALLLEFYNNQDFLNNYTQTAQLNSSHFTLKNTYNKINNMLEDICQVKNSEKAF